MWSSSELACLVPVPWSLQQSMVWYSWRIFTTCFFLPITRIAWGSKNSKATHGELTWCFHEHLQRQTLLCQDAIEVNAGFGTDQVSVSVNFEYRNQSVKPRKTGSLLLSNSHCHCTLGLSLLSSSHYSYWPCAWACSCSYIYSINPLHIIAPIVVQFFCLGLFLAWYRSSCHVCTSKLYVRGTVVWYLSKLALNRLHLY